MERRRVLQTERFNNLGVIGYISKNPGKDLVKLYRFWGGGYDYYTTDPTNPRNLHFKEEKSSLYIVPDGANVPGTIPVFDFYNAPLYRWYETDPSQFADKRTIPLSKEMVVGSIWDKHFDDIWPLSDSPHPEGPPPRSKGTECHPAGAGCEAGGPINPYSTLTLQTDASPSGGLQNSACQFTQKGISERMGLLLSPKGANNGPGPERSEKRHIRPSSASGCRNLD